MYMYMYIPHMIEHNILAIIYAPTPLHTMYMYMYVHDVHVRVYVVGACVGARTHGSVFVA